MRFYKHFQVLVAIVMIIVFTTSCSSSVDRTLRTWKIPKHITSISVDDVNHIIAVGANTGDIFLLEEKSDTPILSLVQGGAAIISLAFSDNGKLLASSDYSGEIFVWRVKDGLLIDKFSVDRYWSESIFFDEGSESIIYGGESVFIRKIGGSFVRTFSHTSNNERIDRISKYKQYIYALSDANTIYRWDVENPNQAPYQNIIPESSDRFISPKGDLVALVLLGTPDVSLMRISDESTIGIFKDHRGEVKSLSISDDERMVAAGGGTSVITGVSDKSIKIWSVDTGKLLFDFQGHKSDISCIDFSSDSSLLASGDTDGYIRLWRLN